MKESHVFGVRNVISRVLKSEKDFFALIIQDNPNHIIVHLDEMNG
jgi:hypothetical protein